MSAVSFSLNTDNGFSILTLKGSLDAHYSTDFDRNLKEALSRSKKIILDLSGLEFISSTPLGVLMPIRAAGGQIVAAGMNPSVRKVFDTMGFSRIFKITDTIQAAKAAF